MMKHNNFFNSIFNDNDSIDIWSSDTNNPYHKLSNLIIREFNFIDGRKYHSVEHCYQSWKSGKFDERTYKQYIGMTKPIKISGRVGLGVSEETLIKLMTIIIVCSLEQNRDILYLLLDTYPHKLTHNKESSKWRYLFPELLMNIRRGIMSGIYIKGAYEEYVESL